MPHIRAISVVLVAVAASCGGGSSGGTGPAQNNPGGGGGGGGAGVTVNVVNNGYTPDRVSVTRGTTVTWRWDTCTGDPYGGQVCTAHTVTFDDGGPSGALQSEGSFARSFSNAGTFTYYCTAHGRAAMSGSVVVQ